MFEPEVKLVGHFQNPINNAVATAKTCYSGKGIVTPEKVAQDVARQGPGTRDELLTSLYQAGHHTTLQHAHFQFALSGISRQFIWSFLHSHSYYNSEQVSQRYVKIKPGAFVLPPIEEAAPRSCIEAAFKRQTADYQALIGLLEPATRAAYLARFPGRASDKKKVAADVQKRCQEVARYVMPVAASAWMYHTISALTLLRYWRLADNFDCGREAHVVVGAMVRAVQALDPAFGTILEDDPIILENTPEAALFPSFKAWDAADPEFRSHFDDRLEGRTSKLVAFTPDAESLLAESIRTIVGVSPSRFSDEEAISAVLNPARNRLLSESLNLSYHSPLMRAGQQIHYTFRKKISHTGDSQDQRHRATPASRPVISWAVSDEPDYIVPRLLQHLQEEGGPGGAAAQRFHDSIKRSWEDYDNLRGHGVDREFAAYVLPNAQAVRYFESGDLLALRHKFAMRLCFNAQEEIFGASMEEMEQIAEVHPLIGEFLLPPCSLRALSDVSPRCPEGDRFCGVKVWDHPHTAWFEKRGII